MFSPKSVVTRIRITGVVIFLATLLIAPAAFGKTETPPGFSLLMSDHAVSLFYKDYPNGAPDYVQVVDLENGARVRLLHAPRTAERQGRGMFGGSDARFGYNSLQGFWQQALAHSSQAFCVSNGQFFYMPDNPTRLALPLKVDGEIMTEGFGYDQYSELLMLELWEDRADIKILTEESLYQSTAPDILGGLPEDANKRIRSTVGRTFVGIDDIDGDGMFERFFVFNTQIAHQEGAAQVLRDFGAKKVMMLDGGGSTQLICNGQPFIDTGRLIPQALAVIAATEPVEVLDDTSNDVEIVQEISDEKVVESDGGSPRKYEEHLPGQAAQAQTYHQSGDQASLRDLLLVPVFMLPFLLILLLRLRPR
jgi:hypothetical protein